MATLADQRSIQFPVGTRVRVVASGGIQTPFDLLGGKGPTEGLGAIARVAHVFSSDQQGLWARLPADQQVIFYAITDEQTGAYVEGNFMNADLERA